MYIYNMLVNWIFLLSLLHCSLSTSIDELPQLAVPEQVHLALTSQTDEMTVTWVTLAPVTSAPSVEYGRLPSDLSLSATGTQTEFVYNSSTRYIHRVTLKGLAPSTTYYYQAGTAAQGWSHVFHFRTLPAGDDYSFRVCVYGDLGYKNGMSLPTLQKAAQRGDFDLVLHIGDFAYDLHTDDGERGDKWMRQIEPIAAYVPYMVIAGNHEEDGRNFSHYKNRFTMPSEFGDNHFYSFNRGPVHFMAVNTEFYGFFYKYGMGSIQTQYNWLSNDLKKANTERPIRPWIIGYQHRPFYCSNKGTQECSAFEAQMIRTGYEEFPGLENLYIDNGVDLVFCGHEHAYERFWPVSRRRVYNQTADPYHNAPAPTYVITGAAGCHSGIAHFEKPANPARAHGNRDYGYSVLHVKNRTHLYMEQISSEKGHKVVDSVWISKDLGHVPSDALANTTPHVPYPLP